MDPKAHFFIAQKGKISSLKEKIFDLFDRIISNKNIDLIDIEIKGSTKNPVICVYVDEPGGITINKCTSISRELQQLLDEKDILGSGYRIDVSSPGLDRPLKNQKDFARNLGRFVKILLTQDGKELELTGEIKKAESAFVEIKHKNTSSQIEYDAVKKALIQIKWK